jgi:glycosyltransferase involved in cell wall biosynthesis
MSVVVPTFDRPDGLRRCLQALAALSYPRERYEVVVVDDGGAAPAALVAAEFEGAIRLRVLRQANAGPAAARNAGARVAGGEYLAFTDDDCVPDPGWLAGFAGLFAVEPGCAAGGRTVNGRPGDVYATASSLLVGYLFDYHARGRGRGRFFPSNNLALPAQEFGRVGGFDPAFRRPGAEDRELCRRWLDRGYALRAAPAAVVHHDHPLELGSLAAQQFGYGRGAWRLWQRSRSARLEPVSFYAGLVASPFRSEPLGRAARLASLLLLTQIAHAAGVLWEALPGRPRSRGLGAPVASSAAAPCRRSKSASS